MIDTGSSWTWTSVGDCDPYITSCSNTDEEFNYLGSATFNDTGVEKEIVYGSTTAVGNITYDRVGMTNTSLSVVTEFLSV